MRLNEFANPKEYTPTATDAEDFLQQVLPIWPDRSADDLAPPVPSSRKLPPFRQTELTDSQSIGSHIGGGHLRSRRGPSQWPTA
jgi:hypothetical protein